MTKREYAEVIAAKVNGVVKEVEKANGVILTGITRETGKVQPCYYIDECYKEGKDIDEVVDQITSSFNDIPDINLECLNNWDIAKERLVARLYNEKTSAPVFQSAKEYGFEDLIIVPYIEIQVGDESGSIKVNKRMVKNWEVTESEIIKTAIDNVKPKITSMAEMFGMPFLEGLYDLTIITNETSVYGAIGVLKVKQELMQQFPNGYIVLPSSVHEVIVVPRELNDLEYMVDMVTDINKTQVSPEEQLSNNVYEFVV